MRRKLFLRWLLLIVGLINLFVVIFVLGLHTAILSTGVGTAIVCIILGLFLIASFKSGTDSFRLSTLIDNVKLNNDICFKKHPDEVIIDEKYAIAAMANRDTAYKELSEGIKSLHKNAMFNKFVAGLSMGLGMVGTVCGLIMMFAGIDQNIDPSNYQANIQLLKVVSAGFGVALYTTLVGLVSSILISIQGFNIEIEVKDQERKLNLREKNG